MSGQTVIAVEWPPEKGDKVRTLSVLWNRTDDGWKPARVQSTVAPYGTIHVYPYASFSAGRAAQAIAYCRDPAAAAEVGVKVHGGFPGMFTTAELLAEAKREITLRKRVYPNRVSTRRLSAREAAKRIAMMQAIADILKERDEAERLL